MKLPKIVKTIITFGNSKERDKLFELELELKKFPKKRRAKLINLYDQYNRGQILKPGENIDNKKEILSKNG